MLIYIRGELNENGTDIFHHRKPHCQSYAMRTNIGEDLIDNSNVNSYRKKLGHNVCKYVDHRRSPRDKCNCLNVLLMQLTMRIEYDVIHADTSLTQKLPENSM